MSQLNKKFVHPTTNKKNDATFVLALAATVLSLVNTFLIVYLR